MTTQEGRVDLGPIHVLIVEDCAEDAELVVRRLRTDGIDAYVRRVDTEADFLDGLEGCPDVIISDLSLPEFDGRQALALRMSHAPGIPFIVMSGTITDEDATTLLDLGASDYILKDRMGRLSAAVRRCILDRPDLIEREREWNEDQTDRRKAETHFHRGMDYLRSLLEASLDPLVTIDAEGRVADVNAASVAVTGVPRSQLIGSHFEIFFAEPDVARQLFDRVLVDGSVHDVELTIRHVDGTLTPVLCNASLYRGADGAPLGVFATARDITLQKQSQAHFQQLHSIASLGARSQQATELEVVFRDVTSTVSTAIPDIGSCEIWRSVTDVDTGDRSLQLVSCAPVATTIGEVQRALPAGSVIEREMCDVGRTMLTAVHWQPVDGDVKDTHPLAMTIRGGHEAWGVLVAHRRDSHESDSAVDSLLREATNILGAAVSRAEAEDVLWYEARHDVLTGLPNRAYLVECLESSLRGQQGGILGVAMIDLDGFKEINDRYGHDAGDSVLTSIGRLMSAAVRPGDMVARLGGDEFALLVLDLDEPGEMAPLVKRLLDAISGPVRVADVWVTVSASAGWTTTVDTDPSAASLLRCADAAMYVVKRSGKDGVRQFVASMSDDVAEEIRIGDELRAAVANDEFVLYYQPQVDLRTGVIFGVEALIRWHHPTRGVIPPDAFLNDAINLGLLPMITERVIVDACQRGSDRLAQDGPLVVSANITAGDLADERLPGVISRALRAADLEPHRLCLEVTENGVLAEVPSVAATIEAIRRLGVAMSIDDFGTGYSSLRRITVLPVAALKIDRSFISGLGTSPNDTAMVSSIISMSHNFGLDVVAEGIETTRQLEHLIEMGCEFGQGFLFGRPMPPEAELPHDHVASIFRARSGSRSAAPA